MSLAPRLVLLLMAVGAVSWSSGAALGETHPSAWRVTAAAAAALVAPLFWPGRMPSLAATAWRIGAWSAAGVVAAAATTYALGPAGGLAGVAGVSTMLAMLLLVAHGLCALLEERLGGAAASGACVTLLLALAGAAPVWLGPAAQAMADTAPGALDAILAASPLTHLAVASGNDLLRNPWLYENTPLGGTPAEYPGVAAIALAYAAALAAVAVALWRRGALSLSVPLETSP